MQADREQLQQLRGYQQSIGLGDDVAAEIVKEAARARVEADLDAAVACIRRRTAERDYSEAVDAVRALPSSGMLCQWTHHDDIAHYNILPLAAAVLLRECCLDVQSSMYTCHARELCYAS